MIWVDQPTFFPSSCVLTERVEGPLVDLETTDQFTQRRYVSPQIIDELARFVGGHDREQAQRLTAELEELRTRVAELENVEVEYEQLKDNVAKTLVHGPSYGRDGSAKIRKAAPKKAGV